MHTIPIGPLLINAGMLSAVIGCAAGYFLLAGLMRAYDNRERIKSAVVEAMLLWIIVWKGSLLLWGGTEVLRNPASLLYLSGGTSGAWLASALAAVYLAARLRGLRREWKAILQRLLPAAACGLIVFHLAAAALAVSAPDRGPSPGEPAPLWALENVAGETLSLESYRGQTVVLNFWASWCPPCRAEMPYLEKLHERGQGEDLVVLALNLTALEGRPAAASEFIHSRGLQLPVLLDPGGDVMRMYGVWVYPTTYIIGPDGLITAKFHGGVSPDTLERAAGLR